ncbi:MAG: YfiR family protein [Thermoanaerobaculia bacterium]
MSRFLSALLLLFTAAGAAGQVVPAEHQAALFSRLLAYDRALKARAGAKVTIGILYKAASGSSRSASDELSAAFAPLKTRTIHGLPFDTATLAYNGAEQLNAWTAAEDVDAIYLCPGLEGEFGEIQAFAARRKLITLTPRREDVQRGVTLGVVNRDGKPGIVVNLTTAKTLGMDLDPKLLQLADVIR